MDRQREPIYARGLLALLLACGCTVAGGSLTDVDASGGASMTDVRVKADSQCQYDVDATPVSADGGGDPCTFLIKWPSGDLPVDAFRIIVDGMPVPPDPTNGWTYTDRTQQIIRIGGPTCDAIKNGTVQTVWVEFYCAGIP